jgi:hypothetical protein
MTKRAVIASGFFAGLFIGGSATFLQLAPKITGFLLTPLVWLAKGWHPYPSESLANLIIALPLMFIYWGCFGALIALLWHSLFRRTPPSQ